MTDDLTRPTAHELADRLRSGETTSREITAAHLARAHATDHGLHAWLTIDDERALAEADAADARLAAARSDGAAAVDALHPLLGIPVALKDLVSVAGGQATAGSRILEGYRSPFDAHITERLHDAGAVILGKTNMDEFAMGSSTRALGVRADGQPVGPRARPRRLQRRLRGGGRGLPRAAGHRHRHRRLDPPARGAVRRRRDEADLRPRQPLRDRGVREQPRPDRAVRPRRPRRGGAAPRGRRPGRARLDLGAGGRPRRPRLAAGVRRRGGVVAARPPVRAPEGVLPRGHGAGRGGADPRGGRRARAGRRDRRGGQPPAHRLRPGHVLHRRAGRGVGEPRALRRRPVRLQRPGRRRLPRRLPRDPRPGLRRRGQAADHARAPTRCRPATTTRSTSRPRRSAR